MRLTHYVVGGMVVVVSFFATSETYAAQNLDQMAPNSLYAHFFESLEKIKGKMNYTLQVSSGVYKKPDLSQNPVAVSGAFVEGTVDFNSASSTFYDANLSTLIEAGPFKRIEQYPMDTIVIGDTVYVHFPYTTVRSLRQKWIPVPLKFYEEFGAQLEASNLFTFATVDQADGLSTEATKIAIELSRKYSVLHHLDEWEDDYVVPGATRYSLGYNSYSLGDYFKDLKKQTAKLPGAQISSLFAIEGFEKGLSNDLFLEQMAEQSFMSLWFDETTQMPVRIVNVITIPPFGKRKETILYIADLTITKNGTLRRIEKPKDKDLVSFKDAVSAFGLNIETDDTPQTLEQTLKELLASYKIARKSDKPLLSIYIANTYSMLGDSKNAIAYFKKAAAGYKKKTVDHYYTLALMEWESKNPLKAGEYLEQALILDPKNDTVTHLYGWFLLGLNAVNPSFRDLNKALEINERLVKYYVDDYNLQNLYATYMLLGRTKDAEKLINKFDDFESGETYRIRAYIAHRLGDTKKAKEYMDSALKADYIQTPLDDRFLTLTF